jgi:hypothetical protein
MSALVVAEPHASQIAIGEKTLELRPTRSRKVGSTIAIIAKGTGTIIGTVRIAGVIGPLTTDELRDLRHRHMASPELVAAHPGWRFGWELDSAVKFSTPVPYTHPNGAQSFVILAAMESLAVSQSATAAAWHGRAGRSGRGENPARSL